VNTDGLAERVGSRLRRRGLTLALAESCTGGLAGDCITDVPGSSDYFLGGIVSYSNSAKQALLGVRTETLQAFGAVSAECAAEMAQGARRALGADVAVSVTGIAGPGGGSADKPTGLTFMHLSAPDAELGRSVVWAGSRRANKESSALAILHLLADYLAGETAAHAPREQRIDEPITVQARFRPDGAIRPTAFNWQGRTHTLAAWGRRWDVETSSGVWRCFLAQTAGGSTVELRWHAASHEWRLWRAWRREALV
jgi:PncC family amidohydrolase